MQQDRQSCEHLARDEQREKDTRKMVVVCVLQEEVETARRVNKTRHSVREKEGKERLAGQHHKECKPCALQPPPSLHLALALTNTPPSPCTPNTLSATSHQLPCCCPPLTIQASPQPSTHCAALFAPARTHSTSKPHAHLAKGGVTRACSRWLCGDGGASMLVVLFVCV